MSEQSAPKRSWLARLFRLGLILVGLYLIGGFLLLPLGLKLIAPSLVSREIAGDVRIGWVWMNPLVFSISLRDVSVSDPAGDTVVSFERLYANADPIRSLFTRELSASAFTLRGLHLRVDIDEAGDINLVRAFELTREPAEEEPEVGEPIDVPPALLRRFVLQEARIDFADRSRGVPFEQSVEAININLNDIRTRPEHENVYEFTARTIADERIELRGVFQLNPLSLAGSVEFTGLNLPDYSPFYEELVPLDLASGRASGGLDFAFRPLGEARQLGVSNGSFSLEELDVRMAGADSPFFDLQSFAINGISVDLFGHDAHVESVEVNSGTVRAERLADGTIDLMNLLLEVNGETADEAQAEVAGREGAEPLAFGVRADGEDLAEPINAVLAHLETLAESDWNVGLGRLLVDGFSVEVLDRVPTEPVSLGLRGIHLLVEDISNAPGSESSIDFRMGINESGQVSLSGVAGIDPLGANLQYAIEDLNLGEFGPTAETFFPVLLESAMLDLSGSAEVREVPDALPVAEVKADLQLRDFSVRQSGEGESFLSFAELKVAEAQAVSEPLAADIREITLRSPRVRVERRSDGQLALLDLVPETSGAETEVEAQVEEALEVVAEGGDEAVEAMVQEVVVELPFDLSLGRFLLENGHVEWIDAAVQPTARLIVDELQVEVIDAHLEPDAERPTWVTTTARFAEAGRIQVEASAIPVDPTLLSKAVLEIRDVPLTVFTPYAADVIGRPITEGAFSGDFEISVDRNALDAKNQLRVQRIRFGSSIPGSSGVGLPVGVAVAALQDRNGLISLDVPIRGDLDNPDFQPAALFAQIVRTTMVRALTAPLSIAGSLVGGSVPGLSLLRGEGAEDAPLDLSRVSFTAGSADLTPEGERVIEALAAFLNERPEAQLKIIPSLDPAVDFEAKSQEQLEARLQAMEAPSRSEALRRLYVATFHPSAPSDETVDTETDADTSASPTPQESTAENGDASTDPAEQSEAIETEEASEPSLAEAPTPRRGFLLSDEAEPREVRRRGFFATESSRDESERRGFYTGEQSPPRPSVERGDESDKATEDEPGTDEIADEDTPSAEPKMPSSLREIEQRLLAEFGPEEEDLATLAEDRGRRVKSYFIETAEILAERLLDADTEPQYRTDGPHVFFEFATELE